MNISGKTQIYGVIGDPVVNTLSPSMHNAAFKELDMDCVYLAFDVNTAGLEAAIRGMRGLTVRGLNVTMPHKSAVIPFLDEVEETSQLLQSINTIKNENGKLRGLSTDGAGAHWALEKNGVSLSGKRLLLLGGGGAAKAIALALARDVAEIVVLNRTAGKLDPVAETISRKFRKKVTVGSLSPLEIQKNLGHTDILVNATSVGMKPNQAECPVKPEWLKSKLTVMDIVYSPLETKLLRDAKAAGAKVISGLEMLVHQGAASFEIWTGKPAPVNAMRQAALKQLSGGKNH